MAELHRVFEEKIRDDVTKGDLFEKLYRDLANYRDDFVFANITRRVFTDLIRLFDRVDALVEEDSVAHLQREDILDQVRSFRSEILQALRRQEVSIIDDGPGSFDEMVQEAVDVAAVPRREDDQKVLTVVSRGFRHRGRLLRPECVVVGRFNGVEEGQDNG
ncbi:MAG: nucleotide exchange factor GrpE [Candidatus Accumulibacter meliphilus]|uniref:nucleotide exchange factor GrpE n=1 Tax=Candidatus Accumulibacter meliphilus TaxID=2211374 RepID=UPI002FC39EBD